MAELQRLFFALWPDIETAARLKQVTTHLLPKHGRQIQFKKYHITLSFLGEVSADKRKKIEHLTSVIDVSPFVLQLQRLGHFSRSGVVWSAPQQLPQQIWTLNSSLCRVMGLLGHPQQHKPFVPHITLLRCAQTPPKAECHEPIIWPVKEFVLVRSHLGCNGSEYEILSSWPLTIK